MIKTKMMGKAIIIAVVLVSAVSCIISRPPYKPVLGGMASLPGHEKEVMELVAGQPVDSAVKLYVADEWSMDSLLRLSQKRYAVFYVGMYYCSANESFFHRMVDYMERHNDYFDLFPMFNYGSGPGYTYDFLRWEQYYRPAFIPDSAKYGGEMFHAMAEIIPTIDRICPECDHGDKMGASAFIVFERGQYLFHTDYTMDDFTCMEMLEKLPLD